MKSLTAQETVRALAQPIGDVGGKFMLHPETIGSCKDFGYPNGFAYYVVGRGGVLGDVDADVISAAFGPFAPSLMRVMWEAGIGVEGAKAGAQRFSDACAAYGRSRHADATKLDRFIELAERVIAAVPISGHSLFVGWRVMPRPSDNAGHAYFLMHLLREWRGSAHILAVAASGLTPVEAILTRFFETGDGVEAATKFGWQPPFADVGHLVPTRAAAEKLTDVLQESVYESALSPDERTEFVAATQMIVDALSR